MARNHGRILASIWAEGSDFLTLNASQQRLYLFLLSQPDLNHAGLLPLRVKRWAGKTADMTVTRLRADLAALEKARYIVTDDDTEELLIRTFVRNDGVHKQPKVMIRLVTDAQEMESSLLRGVFLAELERLPLNELEGGAKGTATFAVEAIRKAFGNPSDTHTDTPGEPSPEPPYVRTCAPRASPSPQPLPPAPIPPTAVARGHTRARGELATREPDHPPDTSQTITAEWLDHCAKRPPEQVIKRIGKTTSAMLAEGIDPDDIRRGLAAWHSKGLDPSTLPSVVNEVMNGHARARASPRQHDTDDQFARQMTRARAKDAATEATR